MASSSKSTSQTSSSTSSTTSASSATCTVTSQTTTSDSDTIKSSIIPFFKSIPAMSVNYSGTMEGSSFGYLISYKVVSTSVSGGVTTYKVNITSTVGYGTTKVTESLSAWVGSDGTVPLMEMYIGSYTSKFNSTTNPTATSYFLSNMLAITTETSYVGQMSLYTGSQFTNEGTSSQTFGPTTMQVTTYDVTNPPIDFNVCGYSGHITAFTMQYGTVPNTSPSLTLITEMHMAGTFEGNSMDFTIKVISITTAT